MKDKTILIIAGVILVSIVIMGNIDITGAWGWPSRLRCKKCYGDRNVVKLFNNCTTMYEGEGQVLSGNDLCLLENRTCVAAIEVNNTESIFVECSRTVVTYQNALSTICCEPDIFS